MWPGSIAGVDAIYGLSLLLVLFRGFFPDTPFFLPPQKPTFPNSNSTYKRWMKEPLCGSHRNSHLFFIFIHKQKKQNGFRSMGGVGKVIQ